MGVAAEAAGEYSNGVKWAGGDVTLVVCAFGLCSFMRYVVTNRNMRRRPA